MSATKTYLNQLTRLTETGSDYAVAKLLGESRSRISGYRTGRSHFNPEMCIRVAELLNLDPLEVIAAIEAEKAKTEKTRRFWKATLNRISGTAATVILSVAVLGGFSHSSGAYAATQAGHNADSLYIMRIII